jgi:hypothetical protein
MVRDPSLLCSHEFVRTSFSPVSFSARLFFHHLRVPSPPSMIVVAKARVASRRLVRDVRRNRERMSSRYFWTNTLMASSAAERRRVDCTPIFDNRGRGLELRRCSGHSGADARFHRSLPRERAIKIGRHILRVARVSRQAYVRRLLIHKQRLKLSGEVLSWEVRFSAVVNVVESAGHVKAFRGSQCVESIRGRLHYPQQTSLPWTSSRSHGSGFSQPG